MSWGNYLFGFSGRINRAKWWLALLILIIVQMVIIGLTMVAQSEGINNILNLIYLLFSIWVSLAVGAKRLHDLNRTAAWLALFVGGPIVLLFAGLGLAGVSIGGTLMSGGEIDIAQMARLGGYAMIISVVWIALAIWALVWLGFLRGTVGPNQYGPDPLQPVALTTAA
jgi:uncharacterized membrane protein YhaH (DUF805 family)